MEFLISVIIPIYNSEKTLKKCIDSVINQSLKKIEIILINDGSTDGSKRICEEYKKNNCKIKVIDKKNEGVSSARNLGIELANGKYIIFIDSDDYIDKNMLEDMYKSSDMGNLDLICNGYIVENEKGKVLQTNKVKNIISTTNGYLIDDILLNTNLSYTWGKLYKTDIIKNKCIKFDKNLKLGEDSLFVYKYCSFINSAIVMNVAQYHFIRSNNVTLSGKYVDNYEESLKKIFNEKIKLFNKYPIYKKNSLKNNVELNFVKINMLLSNMYKVESPLNAKCRKKYIKTKLNENKEIDNLKFYEVTGIKNKIKVNLFKSKNAFLIDLAYLIEFKIKKIFCIKRN